MILVVDGNHLCHQFWHMAKKKAVEESRDPDAEPSAANVLDWILIRLEHLREDFHKLSARMVQYGEPVCVVAFDGPGGSFRKDICTDYKAGRVRHEGCYTAVRDAIQAVSLADDWDALVSQNRFEADDLMASIAAQSTLPVLLHSPDKDMNQCLVPKKVGIIKRSGVPKGSYEFVCKHYRASDFEAEFGFEVSQWVRYQTIVGDTADNVTGCVDVGPVAATKILQQYPHEPFDFIPVAELVDAKILNKKQAANWEAWLPRVDILRVVFTLEPTLKYELNT